MNIHEYQGKQILKSFGVAIQEGIVADTVDQAVEAAKQMKTDFNSDWVVIKAQIHAGGRGKGGGVKLAKNLDELYNYVTRRLLHVNARNDLQALDEIYGLMIEIRSAWESVPELIPRQQQAIMAVN